MTNLKLQTATLRSVLDVLKKQEFLIIVPVFGASDAWHAAKIAKAKLRHDAVLITCVPIRNDYICIFGSKQKPNDRFPVYEASSERGRR